MLYMEINNNLHKEVQAKVQEETKLHFHLVITTISKINLITDYNELLKELQMT
jgi:hypothetical protein